MVKEGALPRRFGPDAVVAEVVRVSRQRRTRLTPAQRAVGLPLMVLAVVVLLAVPVFTGLYAAFGTSIPFLVNAHGPENGPAPVLDRAEAAVLCVLFTAMLAAVVLYSLRKRLAKPVLAVDADGVWLGRGRQVDGGLRWEQIKAVHVVPGSDPAVEVFPVRPVDTQPPLSLRVVNGEPPVPGVRGKRYVFGLAADAPDLARAVGRWAPDRRLDTLL
ncbi:hypothetical protein [Kibdelosporangium phytohabitans]|uniref:PH domain-containing protein n=1 Tax=Kibdelosporangium phytohabitans TaxID=860235 RepID=A0A0N9I3U8_9PSEU|nr:hypothetical protein [Kibdelosporangium phytohabitans]ALG10586.1 hypothetical protein AOZ06_30100 [Kibdelosporangium phytohabitans]MBE1461691.1 hypothetical protein [Kibdelosporangium phytohabitans]